MTKKAKQTLSWRTIPKSPKKRLTNLAVILKKHKEDLLISSCSMKKDFHSLYWRQNQKTKILSTVKSKLAVTHNLKIRIIKKTLAGQMRRKEVSLRENKT